MGRSPRASSARSAAAAFVAASSSSRPVTSTMRRSKSCSSSQPPRLMSRGYNALVPRALLPGRRVRERQLGVARLVDLDHQRHAALMAPHREGLPDVLVRHGIHDLEVRVGTPLHHATAELHLLVRVVEVHDRQGDPGIAAVLRPFSDPSLVHTRSRSPSRPTQTGTLWGELSAIRVARCAKFGRSMSAMVSADSGASMDTLLGIWMIRSCPCPPTVGGRRGLCRVLRCVPFVTRAGLFSIKWSEALPSPCPT